MTDSRDASSVNVLGGMTVDDQRMLAHMAKKRRLRAADFVYTQGDPAEHFYIVESGRIRVFYQTPAGREPTVTHRGPGDLFGISHLAESGRRVTSAQALEPSAIWAIANEDLDEVTRRQVAFAASFAAQGNMAMIMAFTSLALEHHGHPLPAISVAVTIHVVGMFGFSLPLGWLADRAGRRAVMLLGFLLLAGGAVLVPATSRYWIIVTGTFMVGVGWSAATVAATAVIADATHTFERGRAIGTSDTASAAAAIALPLLAGPAVELFGLWALGILGAGLMVPPLVLLLTRSKETSEPARAARSVV
jgi:Major Facilitator Superfamily/Cyclic nucleotide-binding domain